jgi:hypothetical protein
MGCNHPAETKPSEPVWSAGAGHRYELGVANANGCLHVCAGDNGPELFDKERTDPFFKLVRILHASAA